MNRVKSAFSVYMSGIFIILTSLASCNVFSYIDAGPSGTTPADYTARGDWYYNKGDYPDAIISYSNAINANPAYSIARLHLSRAELIEYMPALLDYAYNNISNALQLIEVLNTTNFQLLLKYNNNQNYFQDLINILDSPYGIVNGQGDGRIQPDNLECNLTLAISYLGQTMLHLLDTSGSGVFGGTNDIINSNFQINLSVIDIKDITDSVYNFYNLASELTNFPFTMQPVDIYTNYEYIYNSCETGLTLLHTVALIDGLYGRGFLNSLIRPVKYFKIIPPTTNYYPSFYDELTDAMTNTNSPSTMEKYFSIINEVFSYPDKLAPIFNDFINAITSSNAYDTNLGVISYYPIQWDDMNEPGSLKVSNYDYIEYNNGNWLTTSNILLMNIFAQLQASYFFYTIFTNENITNNITTLTNPASWIGGL